MKKQNPQLHRLLDENTKNRRKKLVEKSSSLLSKISKEIDKEFYPLSVNQLQLSNEINCAQGAIKLASSILTNIRFP